MYLTRYPLLKSQSDLIVVSIMIAITLLFLTLSMQYQHAMFYVDSYTFFAKALEVSKGSSWTYSPFILLISFLIRLYPYDDGLLLFIRTINLVFTVQLVIFIYLIARKLFNQLYSIFTSLLALFLPFVHAYALQLHNDIFAAAMAFTAIYFITKPNIRNTITGMAFIILACSTRGDYSIILAFPIGLTAVAYYTRSMSLRSKVVASVMLLIIIFALGYIVFEDYYRHTTRFGVFERIAFFLRYDLIKVAWDNLIAVTNQDIFNKAFALITISGIVLLIIINYRKFFQIIKQQSSQFDEAKRKIIILTVCFFISFFSIIVFHNAYTIVRGEIIINYSIPVRYFIPAQLFFVFGFVSAISTISNYAIRNVTLARNLVIRVNKLRKS